MSRRKDKAEGAWPYERLFPVPLLPEEGWLALEGKEGSWPQWRRANNHEKFLIDWEQVLRFRKVFENRSNDGPDLSSLVFNGTSFYGLHLSWADFSNCEFWGCNFRHSSLIKANFDAAKFKRTDFRDARVDHASFEKADLRGASCIRFDGNEVSGAKLPQRPTDRWSILKRTYTGPKMFVNFLFLIIYMSPILFELGSLIFLGGIVESSIRAEGDIEVLCRDYYDVMLRPNSAIVVLECRISDIWSELFWNPGVTSTLYKSTLLAILVYQLNRLFLTIGVSNLREDELVSGTTPWWSGHHDAFGWTTPLIGRFIPTFLLNTLFFGYWRYWVLHRIISPIYWVALLIGAFNIYLLLTTKMVFPVLQ